MLRKAEKAVKIKKMTQHHLNPPSFLGESAMKVSGIAHRSSSTPKILADLEQDGSDQSPDLRE